MGIFPLSKSWDQWISYKFFGYVIFTVIKIFYKVSYIFGNVAKKIDGHFYQKIEVYGY